MPRRPLVGDCRLLVIGSHPAATAEAAMGDKLSRAAPQLAYLPDGETGERRDWIVHLINGLRDHPALRMHKESGWSDSTHSSTTRPPQPPTTRRVLDFGHGPATAWSGRWDGSAALKNARTEGTKRDLEWLIV